ncbi:alpha/beta hydrolase-fold protein [Sphingomonas rosea]|uniref:Alpha/beta hydrolase-fold protein n=1 Tax=Sphingomonas rosea TaxID=335605 RepID=A0ABP7TL42_9SPHN
MIRWLLAFASLFLVPVTASAATPDNGRFVTYDQPSATLGSAKVTIWLPPGYDRDKGRRYPVLYMHDGQNVFDPKRSGFNKVWAADKAALQLIRARKVAPFIIVAVDHPGPARYLRYFPTRVADPKLLAGIEGFAKGKTQGDDYLAFLADTVKPAVDKAYRTKPTPRYTATAGSSMGGLISLYALGERPDVFGKAAAVSIHWILVDPATSAGLKPVILADWKNWIDNRLGAPRGRKLWMDHGTRTLDASYRPYSEPVEGYLAGAGWARGKDFESKVYEGAEHEENSWARRLPEIFGWLLSDWRP